MSPSSCLTFTRRSRGTPQRSIARSTIKDDTWASLDFANIQLAFVTPGQHQAHIAVVDANAEKFGPLQRHRDGTQSIYITDPFGNVIELIATQEGEST